MPPAPLGAVTASAVTDEESIDPELAEKLGPVEEPPPAAHPVILDFANGMYIRCDSEHGRTRIGDMDTSTDDGVDDPDRLDESVDEEFRAWARRTAVERMPVYRDSGDLDPLAGIYTMTPDDQAVIGKLPDVRGLVVASGFSGHGFKLAPSIGEGVAQLVLGEPVSAYDTTVFEPMRFAERAVVTGRGFGL